MRPSSEAERDKRGSRARAPRVHQRALVGALTLALVLFVVIPGGGAQGLPPDLAAAFDRGVEDLRAGRLDQAEAAFRTVIEGGGALAQAHNNLGVVYQMRGQHERAITEFRAAAALDPAYPAPRILHGASLFALGRLEEAQTQLEAALRLDPREPLARLQLARVHEQRGDWGGAVEQYRALTELAPGEPEYRYGLGQAYLRLSETCLRRLHERDPDSARSHQARAHSYRMQGRPDLALEAFEQAARADPTLPEIHLAMAQIHAEQKRWDAARREIERERALVPDSAGARALELHVRRMEAAGP